MVTAYQPIYIEYKKLPLPYYKPVDIDLPLLELPDFKLLTEPIYISLE